MARLDSSVGFVVTGDLILFENSPPWLVTQGGAHKEIEVGVGV